MFHDFLNTPIKSTPLERWLLALSVAAVVFLTLRLVCSIIVRRLRDVAPVTPNPWDDLLLELARRTNWLFEMAMGFAVAKVLVYIPEVWERRFAAAVMVIAVLQCGVWATGVVDYLLLAHLDKRNAGGGGKVAYETGRNMLRFLSLIVVWTVVLLLTLENVGINVSTLVAGLGVTGVAVAFATQNVLADLFASVSLLLDKPFLVGDFIITDTFIGTVERIGIRTTRMRSLAGEQLIFANSDLAKSRLRNYKTLKERRIVFTFNVSYDTELEALAEIGAMVRRAVESQKKARFDRAHWLSFGDKGLTFECVFYVLDGDYTLYMDIQQAINLFILRELRASQIKLAYGTLISGTANQPVVRAGAV